MRNNSEEEPKLYLLIALYSNAILYKLFFKYNTMNTCFLYYTTLEPRGRKLMK
jgi:hypothetical protein